MGVTKVVSEVECKNMLDSCVSEGLGEIFRGAWNRKHNDVNFKRFKASDIIHRHVLYNSVLPFYSEIESIVILARDMPELAAPLFNDVDHLLVEDLKLYVLSVEERVVFAILPEYPLLEVAGEPCE
jgi:hypothetical protein